MKTAAKNIHFRLLRIPLRIWGLLLFAVITAFYLVYFTLPRSIAFSYAQQEYCINQPLILPDFYKQTKQSGFKLYADGGLKIGDFYLFSDEMCIQPNSAPQTGLTKLDFSLFGGPIFNSSYHINIGQKPKANTLPDQPLAITESVRFSLDQPDDIFTYRLKIAGKTSECFIETDKIKCDISSLGLKQGSKYTYDLIRLFNNTDTRDNISGELSLLPPVRVTDASVSNNETIFSKPRAFTFTADKQLKSATVTLAKISGNQSVKIASKTKVTGSSLELSIASDLERQTKYRLIIDNAEGVDGSLLESDYVVNFQTSGGPAVTGINIRPSVVSPNATVVLTFDQPLSQTQDISELAVFTGGNATISRTSNQIAFQLHGLPPCSAFSISIGKGLSSNYGITSGQSWSYSSRTTCRTTTIIGYSVMGRPIYAYYYGNGSKTILFTGGIHGNEYSGEYIMQDWAAHLDSYAYRIPSDRRVVIVPSVNPDGLAAGSRYNAHNVNLDRNFDSSSWQPDIDTGAGIIVNGGGTEPMSEPETEALASLTTSLRPRLEVSFHAQGSLVGANQYGDSAAIGVLYASNVGYNSMIGQAEETMGYSITGEYEEWTGEHYGTPAILIELPTTYGRYFWSHQPTLWKMVSI